MTDHQATACKVHRVASILVVVSWLATVALFVQTPGAEAARPLRGAYAGMLNETVLGHQRLGRATLAVSPGGRQAMLTFSIRTLHLDDGLQLTQQPSAVTYTYRHIKISRSGHVHFVRQHGSLTQAHPTTKVDVIGHFDGRVFIGDFEFLKDWSQPGRGQEGTGRGDFALSRHFKLTRE
jgi:hypothetical protein